MGSAAKQLSATSSQDSKQFWSPSGPGHGSPAWSEQVPPEHVSAPLQNSPSEHGAALFGWPQAPAPSHTSSVQTLESGVQAPPAGLLQLSAVSLQVLSQNVRPGQGSP